MNNERPYILIADDEDGIRIIFRELLGTMGYTSVTEARTGAQALELVRSGPPEAPGSHFDLAILDINMPEISGMDVLREAHRVSPDLVILVVTAYGTPELAMEAVREGAYDYFTKPFEFEELKATIQRAFEKRNLLTEIQRLKSQLSPYPEIIGVSNPMRDVFGIMERVVDNDVPVLITGESGTGKEMISQAIHDRGPRRDKPIVKVNCAAIPDQLLESELFGHEKGAFTGAAVTHEGKFEQAHGGTLFLDEIGDMPLALQAKILRAVQEREVQRVGGRETIQTDVRLITATNKNLAEEVAAKRFREDLYFRINVIGIELPPLRKRTADLSLLAEHFIQIYNRRLGKETEGLEPAVMDIFLNYSWPGNIRELENVIQRSLVMSNGPRITVADLPPSLVRGETPAQAASAPDSPEVDLAIPMPQQVDRIVEITERAWIKEALRQTEGRQEAADLLGISRKSLHNKMQKYDMF